MINDVCCITRCWEGGHHIRHSQTTSTGTDFASVMDRSAFLVLWLLQRLSYLLSYIQNFLGLGNLRRFEEICTD